ncbi:MAG: hypothetical protein EZS28_038863 [Streblomastix strix]|uniref:Uncharacterized protein n=1 Tax=Streblomastix strix TaxID=222440 RepID=A0A5J4U6U8_9EUKA|nr:MAG: hypothetical protein EZS28_038863 [Streblomastix strix]
MIDEEEQSKQQEQAIRLIQQQEEQQKQIKERNTLLQVIDNEIIKNFNYLSQFFKNSIDFVNLHTDQIIRGVKTFLSPITAGKIIKQGGTSNQILLANGDTIDKDQLAYEPIENARYSSIEYGMYEQRIWGTLTTQNSRVYISLQITHSDPNTQCESGYTLISIVDNAIKPKFSGTPSNITLNAVMFAYKGSGYPILWNGAIPIDCFINPNGNVIINTMCQLSLTDDFVYKYVIHMLFIISRLVDKFKNKQMEPFGLASQGFNETIIYALDQLNINWHSIFKTIWEAAIKYACESKICH